jgi:Uma2 family endonuclease
MSVTFAVSADEDFPRKKWTVRECRFLVDSGLLEAGKYELIGGDIVQKMGQNPPHVLVISLVLRALIGLFGFDYVQTQAPVMLDDEEEPEPDAAVLVHPLRHYLTQGTPTATDVRLLVEVSDSTLAGDTGTKARIYARYGIADYWVVNIPDRTVIVHRLPGPDGYASTISCDDAASITPLAAPNTLIRVADLLP